MKRWLILVPDEDGNPTRWLSHQDLERMLAVVADHGIREFLSEVPAQADPNYWPDGSALLLQVEIVVPEPVTTAYRLPSA